MGLRLRLSRLLRLKATGLLFQWANSELAATYRKALAAWSPDAAGAPEAATAPSGASAPKAAPVCDHG